MNYFEAKRPVRVSITGMDGSGKSAAYRSFVESLPHDLNIVRVSRFCSVIQGGQETMVGQRKSRLLDSTHQLADRTRRRDLVTFSSALWLLNSWRIQEPRMTARYQPDLVLALRDPYIDPIAYANYYNANGLGSMSMERRTEVLQRLHGAPIAGETIFLDVDPDTAVERIRSRLSDEAVAPRTMERAKWVHLHENPSDLAGIRDEYNAALTYFQEVHGVNVTRIDTSTHSKEEVAELVRQAVLKPLGI